MRKIFIIMSVCTLALSCSKTSSYDAGITPTPLPSGEELTFSATSQESKVVIGGEDGDGVRKYVFESDDEVIAVSSAGSKAKLSLVSGTSGQFKGTFDKPLADDETVSLYYNCLSYDDAAAVYSQNGKPWLLAENQTYTRTEGRKIVITATLNSPEGVVGMPIISGFGACAVDFSAKTADIASFDGTSFSGGKTISGLSLESHSEADADEYTAVVNLPAGMEGGFWLKVTKDSQTMYRSSAATVSSGKCFRMSSFTAAAVNLNVTVSGFPTTYSYAAGTDGVSKNVSTANGKSNAWMGSGTATYTISQEGIPAALLTFQSFTISGEGISASGDETTKTISVGETSSHTSWGAKTITATVTYKDIAGNTYTKSASVTRHITGLPYSAAPPTNSGDHSWSRNGNSAQSTVGWNSDNVKLSGISQSPSINSPSFSMPASVNVTVKSDAKADKYKFIKEIKTTYKIYVNGSVVSSKQGSFSRTTLSADAAFSSGNNSLKCESSYTAVGPSVQIYSVSILYR